MDLRALVELVEGEIVVLADHEAMDIQLVCTTDMMSDVLRFAKKGELLVTSLNQPGVVRTAHIADIPIILVVLGKRIEKEMIELATKERITLLSTHFPMFTVCGRLYAAGLRSCVEGYGH